MTREQLKPVAEAIANQRLMRNGCPAMTNPLDFIAQKPRLVDEVYEDAEAAVQAWEKVRPT
jgi:hypothetical protein